jgi:hypothetical protein
MEKYVHPYIIIIHNIYDTILKENKDISIPWYNKSPDIKCEKEGEFLNFLCPHCKYFTQVTIAELNCRIFRHGFIVQKNEKGEVTALISQISPHESEATCNELRNSPNISGCCMPFQIVDDGFGGFVVQKCGFI